jgi:hypothetical protein
VHGLAIQSVATLDDPALARLQRRQPALQLATALDTGAWALAGLVLIDQVLDQGAIIAVGNGRIERTDVFADAEKLTEFTRILADMAAQLVH